MVVIDRIVDYCIDVNCCSKGRENLIDALLGWAMNAELTVFMHDIQVRGGAVETTFKPQEMDLWRLILHRP